MLCYKSESVISTMASPSASCETLAILLNLGHRQILNPGQVAFSHGLRATLWLIGVGKALRG